MVLLCQEMKWDYFTYMSQPSWFIDLLIKVKSMSIERQNFEIKRANKNGKR